MTIYLRIPDRRFINISSVASSVLGNRLGLMVEPSSPASGTPPLLANHSPGPSCGSKISLS